MIAYNQGKLRSRGFGRHQFSGEISISKPLRAVFGLIHDSAGPSVDNITGEYVNLELNPYSLIEKSLLLFIFHARILNNLHLG